ncbi:alpha/beta hydrolase [Sphingobium sp. CCH11-B1]|jgi:alpha-beta hydrolase superfamily lysophospholipase|uniref:alpha/beta hydrolase n=1 Tax=Sphingobium sp. CCH11-B1 TaxID=1768781 RepID=UPI00082D91D5|nr:alpha/beta fold hydrolase [Sphingobium sp. CCH11-B1]MEA3389532.1 alpha/beta fold hydrolase [Pseudomonadota bacterium]
MTSGIFRRAGMSAALFLTLAGCAGTMRHGIYHADGAPVDVAAFTRHAPRPLRVTGEDGLALTGYYWPGDASDRDVLLFFHGRGSNPGISARYAEYLTGHGDHVIVVSYRGFAGNPGKPTQAGLVADGRAFVAQARRLAGPDARVFLIGHSLGGAVALHVAAALRRDGQTAPVAGVVTLSTFDRLAGSAPAGIGGLLPDKWNNLDAVRTIGAPFLMLQGTADDRVDMGQAAALFAAAQAPAAWIVAPGAGHNPDMARIGPLVSAAVEAIDAHALSHFAPSLPAGWQLRRK